MANKLNRLQKSQEEEFSSTTSTSKGNATVEPTPEAEKKIKKIVKKSEKKGIDLSAKKTVEEEAILAKKIKKESLEKALQKEENALPQVPVTKKVIAKKAEIIVRATTTSPLSPSSHSPTNFNPLNQMAGAFQANAKALQLIQQQQLELSENLERSSIERSKMLAKSNEALNETFKQLHEIQEKVIDKFDHDQKKSSRSLWLLGLSSAFILIALLVALILNSQNDLQRHKRETDKAVQDLLLNIHAQKGEKNNPDPNPNLKSESQTSLQEVLTQFKTTYEERSQEQQKQIQELKQELQQKNHELGRALLEVERFRAAKAHEESHPQNNEELLALRQQYEERQNTLDLLAKEMLAMKQEIEKLKTPTQSSPISTTPNSSSSKEDFLARFNTLLHKNPRPSWYRIEKLQEIQNQTLLDFKLVELSPEKIPLKTFLAKRAKLSLIPEQQKILIELYEVQMTLHGQTNRELTLPQQNIEIFKIDWKEWWNNNEEIIKLR
jgi:hypothetical protein